MIDEEGLQENCNKVGTYLLEELAKLRDEFEIIGDVRGKGLMIGVELVESKVFYLTINSFIISLVNDDFFLTKRNHVSH